MVSNLQCFFVRALPIGLSMSLAVSLGIGVGSFSGCLGDTEGERQADNTTATISCAQGGRADDIVRKTAMAEFTEFGKTCEPYEISTFPQNERETVWRVCCGGAALNYIFFPDKCVARRASGLIQCKN
jgi:hypothetical protein